MTREEELEIELDAYRRAHGILSRGIKQALGLKNWPDFHKMYGSGLFAHGVIRLLNETIEELKRGRSHEISQV